MLRYDLARHPEPQASSRRLSCVERLKQGRNEVIWNPGPIVSDCDRENFRTSVDTQSYLEELYRCSPEIAWLAHLGREFFRMVRTRDLLAWPEWIEAARLTSLYGFAAGLIRDQEAVQAAFSLPWSNGLVEGQVTESN